MPGWLERLVLRQTRRDRRLAWVVLGSVAYVSAWMVLH